MKIKIDMRTEQEILVEIIKRLEAKKKVEDVVYPLEKFKTIYDSALEYTVPGKLRGYFHCFKFSPEGEVIDIDTLI